MKKFVVLSQKEEKDTCIEEQLQSYVDKKTHQNLNKNKKRHKYQQQSTNP